MLSVTPRGDRVDGTLVERVSKEVSMSDDWYVGRYLNRRDLDEIDLLTDLMVAALESDQPMTEAQIDVILRVDREPSGS